MFPLRDSTKSETFPIVTITLIVVQFAIYSIENLLPDKQFYELLTYWGLIPERCWTLTSLPHFFLSIFTAMFLHGGWSHMIGNMWMLWLFGDNVEDKMGHRRYLGFYLLCGILASVAHCFMFPHSLVPVVGASGAVAGIMGAYFILFRRARILTFIFPFFLIPIPAILYLGLWAINQFFSGTNGLLSPASAGSVAFWAHVGGFVCGILLHRRFIREKL